MMPLTVGPPSKVCPADTPTLPGPVTEADPASVVIRLRLIDGENIRGAWRLCPSRSGANTCF